MSIKSRYLFAGVMLLGLAQAISSSAFANESVSAGAYAELPGVKLWFTDSGGKGVPIVLLHSNTGTSSVWERQIASFSRAGYRVIAFDRRGWGKSLANAATGPQPGTIADDLDGLVDHLKLPRFPLWVLRAAGSPLSTTPRGVQGGFEVL